ncbi:SH3 domain-containing protein [Metarhizium album ARSEF 1941]|uniref:SH3 domain-containing protein n=1 Tax=Metarhizium album (strain ARSEF 1941) TaxID=1081103 RepID=A0A0B2X3C5_METAS|nr:SH3 domain-containing protein [Metarhizium album ARSEF 1941]KHN99795.1 SH3 domain-containing protein [Metarhizium album ARSEF 1941]
MTVPFLVKALYEYSSPHEDDLNFDVGQIITVNEEEDDDWYGGEYVDHGVRKEGIFPRNFVEKLEPTAPPRPTRSRPKKEPEAHMSEDVVAPAPPPPAPVHELEPEPEKEEEPEHEAEPVEAERPVPIVPVPVTAMRSEPGLAKSHEAVTAPPAGSKQAGAPVPKPKPGPPPVSEKPSSNSFKDRIAAFNQAAAPPVAPFKPGGLSASGGSSGFVKKPFVAPPPSRNAYVPTPREKPTTSIYRREEDPEIKERQAEAQDQAELAGLAAGEQPQEGGAGDDQPKPTSLKERIALLQKQQMEQAQRHADAAAKREKAKKPVKKKPEAAPQGGADVEEAEESRHSTSLERVETGGTQPRTSTDDPHAIAPPTRRRSSKGPTPNESHDGNEADMSGAGDTTEGHDDTTEREDGEDMSRHAPRAPTTSTAATADLSREPEEANYGGEEGDEEEQEEEEIDPEVRRKEELRARMAKMSGGMGFHGMFGAPMPGMTKAPPKKKAVKPAEALGADEDAQEPVTRAAPPVPTPMALPGIGSARASNRSQPAEKEEDADGGDVTPAQSRMVPPPVPSREQKADSDDEEEDEAVTPAPISEVSFRRDTSAPPPIPGGRPAPPPVPAEARGPPPPPQADVKSPTEGSESDDELSAGTREKDLEQAGTQSRRLPPMPPAPAALPSRSPPQSPRPDEALGSSPTTVASKRSSRPPPPIPGSAPAPPPASSRPPPPPPPPPGGSSRPSTADIPAPTPSRPSQAGEEEDEEVTEYEGDYDTDIASSVPHKDALKSHARDSSAEDNTLTSPTRDTRSNASNIPPVPSASAPRAVPPPVPSQQASDHKRRSVDIPHVAPPPPPREPAPTAAHEHDTGDYSPYSYSSPAPAPPPMGSSYGQSTPKIDEKNAYSPGPSSPTDRRPPPSVPPPRPGNKQSMDVPRTSISNRRSMDMHRPSVESDFIANDVDLAVQSGWWKQANQVPPVFQGRRDIHFESEETTTTNQGSKTVITRDVFVLFQDYSQTVITVRYDPYDPSDVELEQRHEPPPRSLRQDQMEEFYERYGRQISEAATSKKDTVVSDGTPQGFVMELLRPLSGALSPVGTRSYGALVYANMANASTQQQDVIRAGDVISFRNAKFQGKHGPMHAKYSTEVGKPDHVAVVAEWDGTKKKVRAWEQGRENKKVKMESYKLDDLRSGEVKIWRVVPRTWIGWNIKP